MRRRVGISIQVAGLILAGIAPSLVAAQGGQTVSLEDQLKAQYNVVKMGADSNGPAVLEAGTILVIQKGGILGVPYGNMNMMPAHFQDGTLHPPASATSNSATAMGQKMCGLFGKCKGASDQVTKQATSRLFQVGEKVYPSKIEVKPDKDTVAFSVIACDACNNTSPTTFYKSEVIFQFAKGSLATASPSQIEDTIAQVFTIDDSGGQQQGNGGQGNQQQGGQGNQGGQAAAPEPQNIQLGQTVEEVEAALGQPEKKVNLGAKQIYVYKDLKITFVKGKVSDVQ